MAGRNVARAGEGPSPCSTTRSQRELACPVSPKGRFFRSSSYPCQTQYLSIASLKLLLTNFLVLGYLQVYIYTLQTPVASQGCHTRTFNMLGLLCNSAGVRVCLIERTYYGVLGLEISNPGERKHKTTHFSALMELQNHGFS